MRAKTLSNLIILLFTAALASAATRHVPDQYPNIQAAINDCNDGDTVIIAPGTHTGLGNRDIDFKGKPITVRSTDPNDPQIVAATVIDCNGLARAFYFHNGEERDSILAGLTITDGFADVGGGILCERTSPTIKSCTIEKCTAIIGGAISSEYRDPLITHCTLRDNFASEEGGAIELFRSTGALVSNCLIVRNSASFYAGGISAVDGSISITSCVIAQNSATNANALWGYGGAFYFTRGTPIIANCTIIDNSASSSGGGIVCHDSAPAITSSIIWANTAPRSPNNFIGAVISYSNVQGGFPGTGNIDTDPLFIDFAGGDYHLSAASPCIDAGDPGYPLTASQTDIDGQPRVLGGRVDMGADETLNDALAIVVFPNVIRFNILEGQANLPEDTIQICNTGLGALNWRITKDCLWLQVNPQAGTSTNEPNQVALTVDTAGLHWGTYSCQLTVSDPCAINSPQTVDVALDLIGPEIESSATQVDFSAYEGDAVPSQQIFTVRNNAGGLLSWQISTDCDWLGFSPAAGTSRGQANEITLTADVSGLSWGHYDCNLTVSDPNASNSPVVLPVSLNLVGPFISLSSSRFDFEAGKENPTPPGQILSIQNTGGGTVDWRIIAPNDCNWLSIHPLTGQSAGEVNEVTLSVDAAGLEYGSYNCQLIISDPNAQNGLKTVYIYLTLAAPVIAAEPAIFQFHAWQADPCLLERTLSIHNTGGDTLDWEISVPNDCPWLSVYPLSGRSGGDVNVVTLAVDTTGLADGFYACELTITDPNAANSPQAVEVHLHIGFEPGWLLVPSEYPNIQSAIDWALPGDVVLVAPGTYTGPGNRDIDFLGKPITVRSIDPNDPEIVASTIIDCNAGPADHHRGFNFQTGEDANSILAGLTITNGYALRGAAIYFARSGGGRTGLPETGPVECRILNCVITNNTARYDGGGCYITSGNPTIGNCTITENSAEGGGAIYCRQSNPVITNCTIIGNSANYGGAVCSRDSNAVIINCAITGNAAGGGGAIYCWECNAVITNCIINGNQSLDGARGGSHGGGIYLSGGSLVITNCTITDNRTDAGAGICLSDGSLMITNSTISHNKAINYGSGGGIHLYRSNATIGNCIFTGNSADSGGAIGCGDSDVHITNCTFAGNSADAGGAIDEWDSVSTVTNSIFWKNTSSAIYTHDSTPAITYCNIRDAFGGVGNIDLDPLFVDPGYWDTSGTPGNSDDDFWVDGDYHLKSQGWRWDIQREVWTWDDVTSRCIDAGDPNSPLGDEPLTIPADPNNEWGRNIRINMGAFGGTEQASIPPLGWAIPTDYNNDGIADFTDFAFWSQNHGYSAAESPAEPNSAPALNAAELALFADRWLDQTTWFGTLPPPPAAWNPNPPNAAIGVNMHPMLTWQSGTGAASHDVYFGPTDPPAFQANQTETTFYPDYLSEETTYYWRIDEVNPDGTTTGPVWRFTTGTGGSVRCFPAETIVWVDGEMTEICKVSAGSMVDKPAVIQTIAGMRKAVCGHEIEGVDVHDECRTWDRYDITLENGNSIAVADSHYFLLYSGKWVSAENLASGSELATLEGPVTIKSVEKSTSSGAVYNLRIKDGQRYLVGKDGIMVRDW